MMSPVVLFIISLNIFLSLACLWTAMKIVQWRKSLMQINHSLTIAELSLRRLNRPSPIPALTQLQSQVQQLHSKLQPQFFPVLKLLSTTYRMQRIWARTGQKLRSSGKQSAINPRRG